MPCPVNTDVSRAAELIQAGGLVAFPTETVYGLGANAFNRRAVARLFDVKGRPHFDPLIVHVANRAQARELAADFPAQADVLAERFWPGPLTLVLPKRDVVPDLVTAGLSTVALRVPDHPLALDLLRRAGLPIAAPSANLFGGLSPTSARDVADQLAEKIDLILDGGPCRVGLESTVLMLGPPRPALLRPGGVPLEDLEAVIGPIHLPQPAESGPAPASPGLLPRHYAPRTPLFIYSGPVASLSRLAKERVGAEALRRRDARDSSLARPIRVGLLTLTPIDDALAFDTVETLSPTGNLHEAAANFFSALRRLDARELDVIAAVPLPDHGLGRAMNDRLHRAAEPEIREQKRASP